MTTHGVIYEQAKDGSWSASARSISTISPNPGGLCQRAHPKSEPSLSDLTTPQSLRLRPLAQHDVNGRAVGEHGPGFGLQPDQSSPLDP